MRRDGRHDAWGELSCLMTGRHLGRIRLVLTRGLYSRIQFADLLTGIRPFSEVVPSCPVVAVAISRIFVESLVLGVIVNLNWLCLAFLGRRGDINVVPSELPERKSVVVL